MQLDPYLKQVFDQRVRFPNQAKYLPGASFDLTYENLESIIAQISNQAYLYTGTINLPSTVFDNRAPKTQLEPAIEFVLGSDRGEIPNWQYLYLPIARGPEVSNRLPSMREFQGRSFRDEIPNQIYLFEAALFSFPFYQRTGGGTHSFLPDLSSTGRVYLGEDGAIAYQWITTNETFAPIGTRYLSSLRPNNLNRLVDLPPLNLGDTLTDTCFPAEFPSNFTYDFVGTYQRLIEGPFSRTYYLYQREDNSLFISEFRPLLNQKSFAEFAGVNTNSQPALETPAKVSQSRVLINQTTNSAEVPLITN